ncbi:MAG: hypothetical protein LBT83_00425 [Tannerella sp.]|nr:hypothetical protein [Tannerella sp.]
MDANGDPLDYYEASLKLSKTASNGYTNFVGNWTMDAYDAIVTTPGGQIEMQIFVALEPETVSNVAHSSGNITFNTDGLDASAIYRIIFALVDDAVNNTGVYPLDTLEFLGNAVPTNLAMPALTGDAFCRRFSRNDRQRLRQSERSVHCPRYDVRRPRDTEAFQLLLRRQRRNNNLFRPGLCECNAVLKRYRIKFGRNSDGLCYGECERHHILLCHDGYPSAGHSVDHQA